MLSGLLALAGTAFRDPTHDAVATAPWPKVEPGLSAVSIAWNINDNFPLVRQLGARWIDPNPSRWIPIYVALRFLGDPDVSAEERQQLNAYAERDFAELLTLICSGKPDLIILQTQHPSLLLEPLQARAPGLLDAYGTLAEHATVRLLRRKAEAAPCADGANN